MNRKTNYIIFGGSGFVGYHYYKYLLKSSTVKILDIRKPTYKFKNEYIYTDVRKLIDFEFDSCDTIINLAAIHTTPGHEEYEYYETNVNGAVNVCDFARKNNIKNIIFTSSISPYGTHEEEKDENSLLMPNSPYGISKLQAEFIHQEWQKEDPKNRKLLILRPAVIFGLSENGNFSRLYRSISKKYFFYPGRKDTKKACIYVKDLVQVSISMNRQLNNNIHTYNMCYPIPYSIENICNTISKVTKNKKPIVSIPSFLLKFSSYILFYSSKVLGFKINGIHPERISKLMISTNILGRKLAKHNFILKFTLEDAIIDWNKDCNSEGLF